MAALPCDGLWTRASARQLSDTSRTRQSDHSQKVRGERGAAALDQALLDLTNPFTVLAIAARPTDVDEGTVAFCRRRLGARVVILFVTRGESIPSPTMPELNQELGVIRTREVLESARILGADAFFLNLRDFGPSDTADEALRVWGHDETLRRMVRAVRLIKPDAIITNHTIGQGDGIARATAQLARESFESAASATPPPEPGLDPWQAARLFTRVSWSEGAIARDIVSFELNSYDAIRGETYAQMGLRARRTLRSTFVSMDELTPDRQQSFYRLNLAAGSEAERLDRPLASFTDGLKFPAKLNPSLVVPSIRDLPLRAAVAYPGELLDALKEKLIERRAEGGADALHTRYGADFYRVARFTETLERAMLLIMGLSVDLSTSDTRVTTGQNVTARVTLTNHWDKAVPVLFRLPESLATDSPQAFMDSPPTEALPNSSASFERAYEVPTQASITVPHAEHLREQEYYPVGSSLAGTQPAEPFGQALAAVVIVGLDQVQIPLPVLARYDVVPLAEISTIPVALISDWSKTREIEFPLRVRNNRRGRLAAALWLVPVAVSDDEYEPLHLSFDREDEERTVTIKLRIPVLKPPLSPDLLFELRSEKSAPAVASTAPPKIDAPAVIASVRVPVRLLDAAVAPDVAVGVIASRDSWLDDTLKQLSVGSRDLSLDEITRTEHGNAANASQSVEGCGDLSRFTSIVIDELAYFKRPSLAECNRCLLRYARQGGNLIVLAQRADDFRFIAAQGFPAPYPITLSSNRIGTGNLTVRILDPGNPLLSTPNTISAKDFENWTTEAAIEVPSSWSNEYAAPVELTYKGREPQRGGLLFARYGEGSITFVSLSIRRQIIANQPGAYRMLANLVSMPGRRR